MDFELKSVSLDQSSRLSLDALLVAVPDGLAISGSAEDALSRLISQALAPGGLSEERALSERECSPRERGATRAGRRALATAGLSEERAQ